MIATGEKVEDSVSIGIRYADAIVLDDESHLAVARFGPDFQGGADAWGDEFDGVAEEVGIGLGKESFIAMHRQ